MISYVDTQDATTTFTVQRPARGRRADGRCVRGMRRNRRSRRCTRYRSAGSFTHVDAAGVTTRFRFTGRVRSRALRPGSYRLRAVPRNAAGDGPAVLRRFRVKR